MTKLQNEQMQFAFKCGATLFYFLNFSRVIYAKSLHVASFMQENKEESWFALYVHRNWVVESKLSVIGRSSRDFSLILFEKFNNAKGNALLGW